MVLPIHYTRTHACSPQRHTTTPNCYPSRQHSNLAADPCDQFYKYIEVTAASVGMPQISQGVSLSRLCKPRLQRRQHTKTQSLLLHPSSLPPPHYTTPGQNQNLVATHKPNQGAGVVAPVNASHEHTLAMCSDKDVRLDSICSSSCCCSASMNSTTCKNEKHLSGAGYASTHDTRPQYLGSAGWPLWAAATTHLLLQPAHMCDIPATPTLAYAKKLGVCGGDPYCKKTVCPHWCRFGGIGVQPLTRPSVHTQGMCLF